MIPEMTSLVLSEIPDIRDSRNRFENQPFCVPKRRENNHHGPISLKTFPGFHIIVVAGWIGLDFFFTTTNVLH
jgi:hypothetical protein